jgi:hypothetical protein
LHTCISWISSWINFSYLSMQILKEQCAYRSGNTRIITVSTIFCGEFRNWFMEKVLSLLSHFRDINKIQIIFILPDKIVVIQIILPIVKKVFKIVQLLLSSNIY